MNEWNHLIFGTDFPLTHCKQWLNNGNVLLRNMATRAQLVVYAFNVYNYCEI